MHGDSFSFAEGKIQCDMYAIFTCYPYISIQKWSFSLCYCRVYKRLFSVEMILTCVLHVFKLPQVIGFTPPSRDSPGWRVIPCIFAVCLV
jgi:hypothetical protein